MEHTSRIIASILGLSGFVIAALAGLFTSADTSDLLTRALVASVSCYAVGTFLGYAAERCVREFVESHIESNPIPDPPAPIDYPGASPNPAPEIIAEPID
ncbi:MAG: hypothetical protein AAGI17_10010 [Planctomycetota bacterium]